MIVKEIENIDVARSYADKIHGIESLLPVPSFIPLVELMSREHRLSWTTCINCNVKPSDRSAFRVRCLPG